MAGHARYTALLDACVLYPLAIRRDQMREAIPDWEVPQPAWEACAGGLHLPDPDDVHVLASALAGHADCIVTANLKDFPPSTVASFGIEVIHPDQFIVAQWDLDPLVAVAAFKHMRTRWRKPEATAEHFADAMERGGLPATAQRLREALELIWDLAMPSSQSPNLRAAPGCTTMPACAC